MIGHLWRNMHWFRRLDLIVLALMLAYVVIVFIRVFHRFRSVQDTGRSDAIEQQHKKLAVELCVQAGALKAIAFGAPYLGLLGTSVGIMIAFGFGGFAMERNTFLAWISMRIAAALLTTAAGIVVAVPAICAYNYLRVRVNLLKGEEAHKPFQGASRNFLVGEKFALSKRFSHLPPFPLIAAPCLAALVVLYTPFFSPRRPTGLDVELAPAHCALDGDDRLIVLRVTNSGEVFINLEPQDWSALSGRLSEIYNMRRYRTIYFVAENDVPFQTAADAIDIANSLSLNVRLITPAAMNARCPEPVAIRSARSVRR